LWFKVDDHSFSTIFWYQAGCFPILVSRYEALPRTYSIGCHTLSRHVASNQSVELRDVVAPIVSSDASELANTVSSLLSMHSCHKNRCIAAPTISSA
jgi:hypothetical protein